MVNFYINKKKSGSFECSTYENAISKISEYINTPPNEFYIEQNGKKISSMSNFNSDVDLHCYIRLLGGKGGFGSMLRAIGAQIEKTTNREACRDLSGRRLRDINEEKRLKTWLDGQKDREREAEEKKARKVQKLLHVPKNEFKDTQYEEARSKLTEKVCDAVEEGLKNSEMLKEPLKRKADSAGPSKAIKKNKKSLWLGDDISDESDFSDSDNEEVKDLKIKK